MSSITCCTTLRVSNLCFRKIQSFSLRRTAPARPNIMSGPTASIQVNALLKKANAIRQVSFFTSIFIWVIRIQKVSMMQKTHVFEPYLFEGTSWI